MLPLSAAQSVASFSTCQALLLYPPPHTLRPHTTTTTNTDTQPARTAHVAQFAKDEIERETITRREARPAPQEPRELIEYFLNTLAQVCGQALRKHVLGVPTDRLPARG